MGLRENVMPKTRKNEARSGETVIALAPPVVRDIRGTVLGRICSSVGDGPSGPTVQVDYPGNPHGPLAARIVTTLPAHQLREGAEVLLVFDDGASNRPIVAGVVATSSAELAPGHPLSVSVDGRRVTLDATDEVVLRCGAASITLRRNGRVVIRGAHVETHARGVNRIKGGSVQIN